MKKLISLLIIVACLLALSGCGIAGTILSAGISIVTSKTNLDYEGEAETFYFGEFTITLTDRFSPQYGDIALFTSYSGTWVEVENHSFMYSNYSEGLTIGEYASIYRERLLAGEIGPANVSDVSDVLTDDGLVYLSFSAGGLLGEKYVVGFYLGTQSLWICSFSQSERNYDVYEPYFFEWASSVRIINSNAEA